MVNNAFQNSLTGRDSEKFTASLREGGTIHSLQDGATIEETVVTGTRDSSADYSPYFSLGGSSSRRVEDAMSASRDIGDQLFQSDPEMFSKFHFAGKADKEEGHDFKDGIGPNMKEAVKDITDRNKKRYDTTDKDVDALLNISDLYGTGEIDETVVVGNPRYNDTLSNINKLETFYRNNFNKKAVNINKEALAEAITLASQKNNINADYITLLLAIETDLREKEVSSTGAKSIAQLAPIALKDVNQNFDTDYTMKDITGNLNSAVDAQAKYIKLVIKYAANAGLDSTDPSIIGEMYNVGPGNYIKGLADPSIPLSSNPRYIGTRGIERGEALGIDITTIPIQEFPSDGMIPKFNQGGITTEPWGGSNASLYSPPQRLESTESSSVQKQTEQVFNSTPRLNEGGTPTQGIDEIVVTGKRDDSPSYNYDFSSEFGGEATGRQVKDSMASSRDIGDQLFQSDPEFFAKLSYAQKADKEDGTNDNVLKWQEEMIERNKNKYTKAEEGMEKYPDVDTTIVTAPSSNVVDMREKLSILTGNNDFMDIMKFDTANVQAIIKDKNLQSLIFDNLSEEEKLNTQSRISNKQDADAALDIAEAENTKELFYQDEFDSIENRDSSMSKEGAVLKVVSSFNPTDSTLSVDEKLANLNKASEFLSVLEALDPDTYNKNLDYNQNYKKGILTSDDPTKFSSINPLFNKDNAYPGRDFDKEILDPQISNIGTLSLKQINDDIKKINYHADIHPDAKNYYVKQGYGNLLPVVNNLMLLNGTDMTI